MNISINGLHLPNLFDNAAGVFKNATNIQFIIGMALVFLVFKGILAFGRFVDKESNDSLLRNALVFSGCVIAFVMLFMTE